MKPREFKQKFMPYALKTQGKTGILAVCILAQAALESGWGKFAPGNMFFGVKDKDGINGNEQLLTTTEYSTSQNLKFPVILSVTPVNIKGKRYYKYRIKDYFRKYETPEECFDDHASFFFKYKWYATALLPENRNDPERWFTEIHKAGYATDPSYVRTLMKIVKMLS